MFSSASTRADSAALTCARRSLLRSASAPRRPSAASTAAPRACSSPASCAFSWCSAPTWRSVSASCAFLASTSRSRFWRASLIISISCPCSSMTLCCPTAARARSSLWAMRSSRSAFTAHSVLLCVSRCALDVSAIPCCSLTICMTWCEKSRLTWRCSSLMREHSLCPAKMAASCCARPWVNCESCSWRRDATAEMRPCLGSRGKAAAVGRR
mmetsp:Transcript_21435/g.52967  ORF Transcript_21435/g.52967 Transcript_21435/m.52967 type:complete len:212 (-) Transcript_21435:8-643(-)